MYPTLLLEGKSKAYRLAYQASWLCLLAPLLGFVGYFGGILAALFIKNQGIASYVLPAQIAQISLWVSFSIGLAGLVGLLILLWLHGRGVDKKTQDSACVRDNWVAIAAMADNRAIGLEGKLPWHIKEEFQHFKATTMGGVLLLGRRTWEDIGAKPLPGREHWVISSRLQSLEGAHVFPSLETALAQNTDKTVYVCGGATLYEQALPYCRTLLLSRIKGEFDADTFFPPFEHYFGEPQLRRDSDAFTVYEYHRL